MSWTSTNKALLKLSTEPIFNWNGAKFLVLELSYAAQIQ
ncbi:hypothetical protein ACINNAV83_1990 [Acinetobacter baumannii Naval-83]|nr:hypothetical protein ACINNAV83_1990 [Acinetobacter baumannii Naval-83]